MKNGAVGDVFDCDHELDEVIDELRHVVYVDDEKERTNCLSSSV